MSNKFTSYHHGSSRIWINTSLTMDTQVIFSRDIIVTDVSNVGAYTQAYFAIADGDTRQILAYAHVPAGDVKTRLTVNGGGKLILRGNKRYILSRWHAYHGDLGWGNGVNPYYAFLALGLTAIFSPVWGNSGSVNMTNPAHMTQLAPPNHDPYFEGYVAYSTIPYLWWEELITPPSKPYTMTAPASAKVGAVVNVSWDSVIVPIQPGLTPLPEPIVYYEARFLGGGGDSYIIASKTTARSVAYTIPKILDTTNARFTVRAFVEAYGARYYGDYTYSGYLTIKNNAVPTTPSSFLNLTSTTLFTIGRSYTVSWTSSTDADGETVMYELDYYNGETWSNVLRNGLTTSRTFHVPSGPNTSKALFRVRAYDGKEYSPYRLSPEFRVERNLAPTTPQPFTTPIPDELRYVTFSYNVVWGPVDNQGNKDIFYELQFRARQSDAWQTLVNISAQQRQTSFTHTLPNVQDSGNAQYRVRAYDGMDYGEWQESSFFKITGNTVTNTKGFNEELKARYAVDQEVILTWSAGTTVRESVVLYDFEIFDGFNWKEVMYNLTATSIVFRIPKMNETNNARFRIRSKTAYDFGGYVYSNWLESRTFTVVDFFKYDNIVLPYPHDIQKKENVDYLRQLVNEMRTINLLPFITFKDEVIIRYETVIKNIHFDEIEEGILDCYSAHANGHFTNSKTETEMRRTKVYDTQQDLLMDLPHRLTIILRALMNI